MHYIVHCLDHPGGVEKRLSHYDAHKAYLAAAPVKTVISGPLLADDEQTMIGSCFVIEADSLAEVEDFNRNDPDTYNKSTAFTVYDAGGNGYLATVYYVKTKNADQTSPTLRLPRISPMPSRWFMISKPLTSRICACTVTRNSCIAERA
mgnify:CR=1 FL=1